MACALLLQAVLLTVPCDGEPMRFGAPIEVGALDDGLSLRGKGALQWRPLPVAPTEDGRQWVELAIVAPRGSVRVVRGGAGPDDDGGGAAFVREQVERDVAGGHERTTTWRWCDGTVDVRRRCVFAERSVQGHEVFVAGEALTTDSAGLVARARCWRAEPRRAIDCGLLPERGGGGAATRDVRRHLVDVVAALRELPGVRGAGDFARGDGTVTNLEFDTTFALLRHAVSAQDPRAFAMAQRCARHLVDRDLDGASGLPFVHGVGHRSSTPQPGHVWLRGLLWVGLLTADDELVEAARGIGRALAARPPDGQGQDERLRDFAWPLAELEFLIRFTPEPVLVAAADRIARVVLARFDPAARTFRFGEGEVGDGLYFERAWLTAGLLVPALRAHLARRPDVDAAEKLRVVEEALLERIGSGGAGLPTHWRVANGRAVAEHRERGTVRAAFLLDGAPAADLRRLLRRRSVRRALADCPQLEDPDLPTSFTLLARCDWVWR